MNLKKCPFCGKNDKDCRYSTYIMPVGDRYVLSHTCNLNRDDEYTFISIYGDTEKEVINKWNKRHDVL
jgi:hypothetical protein